MNASENNPNPYQAPATPLQEESTGQMELATRGQRFGAAMVDGVLGAIVLFALIFLLIGWDRYMVLATQQSALFSLGGAAVGFVIWVLLHGYLIYHRGQSIGKYLVGIRIVRQDGSPASFSRILLWRQLPQSLVGGIPVVGGWALLVNYLLIFRATRRCGHDDLADTKVVKV